MLKNSSGQKIGAQMVSATDGSAFTGSVTVAVTVDAGTQATGSVGSGACTHEGGGYHTYAPAQAETNGDLIAFTFSGTGAVPVTIQVYTLPTTGVLAPTVLGRTLDVSSGGEAGLDWANIGSPTASVVLSGTTIGTLTTYTGNTPQTGDSYAIVNSGTHGNAALKTLIDTVDTVVDAILVDTAEIGAAGAGLTAIPWNASWDAEVQSEVQDAIEVNHLDHFIAVADPGGVVANSSFLAKLVSKSATPAFSSYDNTTDSLEANRDNIGTAGAGLTAADDAVITAIGALNNLSAAQVNAEVDTALADAGVTTTRMGYLTGDAYAAITSTLPDSVPSDGTRPSLQQAAYMTVQYLIEKSISGTTVTVKKVDGSTTLYTLALDSSSAPTSSTRNG